MEIKCVNEKCSSPTKSFYWNEKQHIKEGATIFQTEISIEGVMSIVADCTYCSTLNKLWVVPPSKSSGGGGGGGLRFTDKIVYKKFID